MDRVIKIEVMFFDLDGTLVDSLDDIGTSVNHTLTTLGYSALPKEKLRRFVGDGMQTLLVRALSEFEKPDNDRLMTAVSIYRAHHDEHCLDFVRTYDGVLDVLTHFNHCRKFVISNKAEVFTRKIIHGLGLSRYFEEVYGGDSFANKKPHPQTIQAILEKTGVHPDRAMIIGDGPQDIEAGRRAGIYTCAVRYGFHTVAPEGADFYIDRIIQIKELVV